MSWAQCIPGFQPHDLAQAPAHTVALDRISDFFRNGEADPDRTGFSPVTRLQDQSGGRNLDSARSGQKVRSLPEALHCHHDGLAAAGLSAQALAAAGTARGDDLAAADSGHAGTEAMAALAHELARLIGPFHGVFLRWSRRNAGCVGWFSSATLPQKDAGPPTLGLGRLIRE